MSNLSQKSIDQIFTGWNKTKRERADCAMQYATAPQDKAMRSPEYRASQQKSYMEKCLADKGFVEVMEEVEGDLKTFNTTALVIMGGVVLVALYYRYIKK